MRSLALSLILVMGVAAQAHAQPRITAPITKARAAAAAVNTRVAGQDAAAQQIARDSVPPATPSAGPAAQTAQKPTASKPATTAASKPGTSTAAPVKPDTATRGVTGAASPTSSSTRPTDTTKAGANGKSSSAPGATDRNAALVPPPQATPGKAPAGSKAPAGTKSATPADKPAPVTPNGAKPSPVAEAVPGDVPPTSVGSGPSTRPEIAINREVFQYDAAGRRDPFVSLLLTSDLRPLFSDLMLVVINYDPQGRNSVAIMRDATTHEQYRVRQGQLIGRMRVAAIEPKRVMFTIDEFGFSRQESLVIGDTTKVRKQ